MTKEDNKNKTFKNAKSKRTERFSDMLLQVTTDLAKTKSLDEALETLVKITTSTIGAERGTIFLNDASTGELYSRIAQGNFRREIRILNTKGVAGWVFSKNQGVYCSNFGSFRINPIQCLQSFDFMRDRQVKSTKTKFREHGKALLQLA